MRMNILKLVKLACKCIINCHLQYMIRSLVLFNIFNFHESCSCPSSSEQEKCPTALENMNTFCKSVVVPNYNVVLRWLKISKYIYIVGCPSINKVLGMDCMYFQYWNLVNKGHFHDWNTFQTKSFEFIGSAKSNLV